MQCIYPSFRRQSKQWSTEWQESRLLSEFLKILDGWKKRKPYIYIYRKRPCDYVLNSLYLDIARKMSDIPNPPNTENQIMGHLYIVLYTVFKDSCYVRHFKFTLSVLHCKTNQSLSLLITLSSKFRFVKCWCLNLVHNFFKLISFIEERILTKGIRKMISKRLFISSFSLLATPWAARIEWNQTSLFVDRKDPRLPAWLLVHAWLGFASYSEKPKCTLLDKVESASWADGWQGGRSNRMALAMTSSFSSPLVTTKAWCWVKSVVFWSYGISQDIKNKGIGTSGWANYHYKQSPNFNTVCLFCTGTESIRSQGCKGFMQNLSTFHM